MMADGKHLCNCFFVLFEFFRPVIRLFIPAHLPQNPHVCGKGVRDIRLVRGLGDRAIITQMVWRI
jgi:hypothetical protein